MSMVVLYFLYQRYYITKMLLGGNVGYLPISTFLIQIVNINTDITAFFKVGIGRDGKFFCLKITTWR